MIEPARDRGPLQWTISFMGIRGGIIRLLVSRNRMSFVKKYIFKNDESFETAINILRNKVTRILHLRNDRVPALGKIANYALESTDIVETKDTTGWYKDDYL